MLSQWNEGRHKQGLPLLTHDLQLEQEAQRIAQKMAAEGPVNTWSVERGLMPALLNQFADLQQITGTLLYGPTPTVLDKAPWLKNKDWAVVGIGLVPAPTSDLWFVCILVGQPAR
jgi:hypothetical protein